LTHHGLIGAHLADYDYDKIGYNYAMTELQAAIGLIQLKKLKRFNQRRSQNAANYRSRLKGSGLRFQTGATGCVDYCLTAILPEEIAPQRDRFLAAVRAEGALINCLYPLPLSGTKLFKNSASSQFISPRIAASLFNLYTNPDIDEHFINICCEAIRKVIENAKGDGP
jgi:perosamine synthetase